VHRLFHVTDGEALVTMSPKPSPPGTEHAGREWVWAVNELHLPNYLLPRDCPRVCWRAEKSHTVLGSPAGRVVAIEYRWVDALTGAGLSVHTLDPTNFTLLDGRAGYWVSGHEVRVLAVLPVDDCFAALAEHDIELRIVHDLWPYVDAVSSGIAEFSAIRMRNAAPRG
jgi:hypothetical protein